MISQISAVTTIVASVAPIGKRTRQFSTCHETSVGLDTSRGNSKPVFPPFGTLVFSSPNRIVNGTLETVDN